MASHRYLQFAVLALLGDSIWHAVMSQHAFFFLVPACLLLLFSFIATSPS